MLKHEFLADSGILVVMPEESLTSADFVGLAAEVDPYIEANGDLRGLLIQAASFPGWSDFGAFLSHLRFVRDHHRNIAKVAAVSDSSFLSILPTISEHFVSAKVRHFGAEDRDAAMAWLLDD